LNYTVGATTGRLVVWTARNAWERAFVIGTVNDRHNMTLRRAKMSRWMDGRPASFCSSPGATRAAYRVAAGGDPIG
jgi:hypothetical protein